MDTNLEKAYAEVKLLVDGFKENERHYLSNEYQEAEARIDFINKFFIALGWDVNHDEQKDPYRQEVKVEKTQSNQKRPDYSFFLTPNYKDPIFFIEAKKPAKNLKDKNFYFQTIKYGWNAGTPLAVLTDFEEFHILDCRYKPNINYVLNGSHQYYHYSQYADKEIFAKIYYLFSREAVADNSIERYAKELKKPSGKAVQRGLFKENIKPIDDDFLEFIDGTRETLARAFKKNDTRLDSEELTEAVQRTIDRLVFIRFLEDKLIEQENYISEFGESGAIWKDFIAVCRKLDAKYNGVVFKKHFIDDQDFSGPELKGFSQICGDISHLNSPYDFNVIPIHILGSIYERFLGKVVHATDKRVTVEEKPEVRKAGGVYYTPKYIVDYIVKNTVGELIKGKTPAEISKLRIADIACGSGSFLIGAFECLLDYHNSYYRDHPEKAVKDGCIEKDGRMILSIRQKQRILLNNIYGVDIDAQAVEVTQLSLALKMLEDETTATANDMQVLFHEKIIPNLGGNIVCGNSLIGTDILSGNLFSGEEERKLNPMDFESAFPGVFKDGGDTHGGVSPERAMDVERSRNAQGFDCVIGNPPYVRQEMLSEFKGYFEKHYKVYHGVADLYTYFIERGISFLKNGGIFSFIVANKWMRANYGKPLREYVMNHTRIKQIIDFGELKVFENASTFPEIIVLEKKEVKEQSFLFAQIKTLDFTSLNDEIQKMGKTLNERALGQDGWSLSGDKENDIIEKMKKNGIPLGEYVDGKIFYGIKTGLNEAFVIDGETRERLIAEDSRSAEIIKPFAVGDDIRKYHIRNTGKFLIFTRRGIKIDDYPAIKKHLLAHKNKLEPGKGRKPGNYKWYEIQDTVDYYKEFEKPKIVYPDIAKESRFMIDSNNLYFANTVYMIPLNDYFLLGLLNSKLIFWYFKNISAVLGDANKGGRLRWFAQDVVKIPIASPANKFVSESLVSLVDQILSARKELHHAKTGKDKDYYERRCRELDSQIDRLVYELYGLTEEEIRIVEGVHE